MFQGHFLARKLRAVTGSTSILSCGFDRRSRALFTGRRFLKQGLPGSHYHFRYDFRYDVLSASETGQVPDKYIMEMKTIENETPPGYETKRQRNLLISWADFFEQV